METDETIALRSRVAFLERILENLPIGVTVLDREGSIVLMNRAQEEISLVKREKVIGHPFHEKFNDVISRAGFGGHYWPLLQDQKPFEMVFHAEKPLSYDSEISGLGLGGVLPDDEGAILLFHISEKIREDRHALSTLADNLAVSEKLAIYSELIAGIFHQINNPLVGVVNFSALLLEKLDEQDANRSTVETIHEAARHCQVLISSMMRGFREPQSTFSRLAPGDLLEYAIAETMRERGESAHHVVVSKVPDDLPEVRGDMLQLGQVFRNLLDNAFQAMPEGGAVEIGTAVDEKNGELIISFADTGCGIPGNNLARIFTPFFSTKQNTGGGLGLSFAYRVIKNHAGRIEVDSTVGQGSEFRVILPYVAGDEGPDDHGH